MKMDTNNLYNIEEDTIDIDNIEDVSDVYTTDIVNEFLTDVPGSAAESSAPTVNGQTFDDSNIIDSISNVTSTIELTNESLEHTNHRLDQTYDLVIVICFLLAGFIAISIFRKLFDWLV